MHLLSVQLQPMMLSAVRLTTAPFRTVRTACVAPPRRHLTVAAAGTGSMVKATWSELRYSITVTSVSYATSQL